MRRNTFHIALLLCSVFFAYTVPAQNQETQQSTANATQNNHQNPPKCTDNGTYTNSQGQTVKRPETCKGPTVPAGATAQCRDGSYSFSQSRRGTCSHHGGVGKWL